MISESASTPPGSPELRNPRSRPSTEATTPNQTNGPFVSIANGPLAKLAANHSQSSKPTSRPQSFLSNLFNRSPSLGTSSSGQFANPSPRSPALNTIQSSDARHNRTQSLPPSPVLPQTSRASTDSATRDSSATTTRTSPRLSRTFAGLGRSVSLRTSPDRPTPPSLPLPPQSSKPAKVDNAPNSLDEMGLSLVTNTPQLRHSQQPLCGCVLDDKYLLIGTSNGLDFLPLPLPGSLPIHQLGKKKRKEIRKPISLIKRTRFRELVVLSERSNVLLAIAGRTDQVRVYALDGVRALIEKKMTELDIQDGYPWIQDSAVLYHDSISSSQKQSDKGKGKAPSRSRTTSTATSFDPPPPDYVPAAESSSSSSNPRRRPPPLHLAPTSSTSFPHPPPSVSPSTLTFSRRGSLANGAIVREVPTPSTSRTIRPQASREFSAGRKGSKATVQRRKSSVALSPSTTVPGGGGPTVVRPVHRQQKLLPRPEGRVGTSDLADFLRESGPDEDRENTNNNVRPVASGSRYVTPGEVSPRTNGLASSVAGPSTPRNRKRWTIDGTNSSLPNPVHSAVPEPLQPSTNIDRPRRISATEAPRRVHERSGHAGGGIDSKHAFRRGSEFDNFLPSLPPSSFSQEPRDQFSDNNSPLEYVKLARSRGSRLFRAVETKRRTYLAVLCGDEGERIELFTGSRSVSLSLNRTFVLPETPRSIDFQLQGDDLVDIYLIYDQSIFALEPSTIRVREVGVGRRSRGGGGDRNRERRTPATPIEENSGLERALDPTESPRRETRPVNLEVDDSRAPSPTTALPTRASSPSPETRSIQDPPSPSPRRIIRPEPRSTAQSVGPRTASTRKQPPYTTFTQLESIPPLPSGILSSQWTIPPLYQDVVAGSSTAPSPLVSDEPPLLSPVSLLRGAAMRNNGRPGLFYVSRGNALTGIVTADGKSIIKKPICWSSDPTRSPTDDSLQHIETLVVGGKKTVVVKLSNSEVKAISLEEGTSIPTLVASSTSLQLGIQFLSTHSAGQQTFFAQSTGTSSWVVKCLAARNS
ncbi:uncharacterized protein JCM6883_005120 [Sporobolomyces salmoneus]|uniref:uncharacterized protein n=1 Tax=Sporobolomyces salmoneus TaxID=183962 RepID=UPI003180A449